MNKSELIEAIAQEAGISKSAAQKALDATTNAVTNALKSGDTVTLVGFGTFYVGERAERQGRNPKTGEPLTIAAAKTPKFRAGKALKDALLIFPCKKPIPYGESVFYFIDCLIFSIRICYQIGF